MIIEGTIITESLGLVNNILQNATPKLTYMSHQEQLRAQYYNNKTLITQVINQFQQFVQNSITFENYEQLMQQHTSIWGNISIIEQIFKVPDFKSQSHLKQQLQSQYQNRVKAEQQKIFSIILPVLWQHRFQTLNNETEKIIKFIKQSDLQGNQFIELYIQQSKEIYQQLNTIEQLFNQYQIEEKITSCLDDEEVTLILKKLFFDIVESHINEAQVNFNNLSYMKQLNYLSNLIQSSLLKGKIYDVIYKDLASVIQSEQKIDTINKIVEIKYFYEDKLKQICPNDEKIKSSLSNAFESAILLKVNTLSEQFSQFLDSLLVKKDENKNEELVLSHIKQALDLLKYFSAKDIFEHFYTQRLTRRLLLDLSLSLNLEVEILQILKQQCGDQYVRKAEEVLKDVRKSYDYEHQGVKVNLVIISQNSWTLKTDEIPKFFLQDQRSIFLEQHQQDFKQKLLLWLVDCSHCQVKAFNKFTLLVSAVQAMILDFYNVKQEYKPQELIELSGLSKDEILRNLLPLEKEKILQKSGTNTFKINFEFQSKRNIIKINQMQKNEKKEEIEQSTEKLLHDRKYVIDASIVKIMKRDKQHTLIEIINLVLRDLGLPINKQDIKQQIEVLTEKEYLQRDQDDMNLFIYLA